MVCYWLLTVVLVHLVQSNEEENNVNPTPAIFEPSWVYKCIPDEGCQRSGHPGHMAMAKGNTTHFESLDICRMVCGRFGGLWPKPLTASLSTQTVTIHPNYLRFDLLDVPTEARALATRMTQVFTDNLVAECSGNVTRLVATPVEVFLSVKSANLALTWDTDEEYTLEVQTKQENVVVHIQAETVYGARHAFESLNQLISADRPPYTDDYECGLQLVSGAKIKDGPAYKHRGLVLDTSRNFVPMEDIKRTIDGMAATKMNVFHWHVTDSHSFPLESTRVPQFTRYGAYSAYDIYSTEEVRDLITYAQVRGVRVVVEIDSPAHAGNGWQWGKEYGLGDLAVCVNAKPWRSLCVQPPCGQLNPANPHMYRILRNLYRDIAELLPQPALLHMGGDEVFLNCWNSTEEITTYMRQRGLDINVEGFIALWAEFHTKALKAWDEELEAAGGTGGQPVMLWSSELTQAERIQRYLDPNRYVIEVWEPLSSPLLEKLLRLGYRTITVPKDVWYLDHGFWGITKYANWRRMYDHRLSSNEKNGNLLGGEVAMWSEYVDSQGLDTRIWPRAAAVGERLWSNPTSSPNDAEPRLQGLRERLIARGLRPDVMSPAWCAQHAARCL